MSVSFRAQLSGMRDWLFPRRCLRKQRWTSEHVAKSVMRSRLTAQHDRPQELYCYECKLCGGWHLTRMKQPDG